MFEIFVFSFLVALTGALSPGPLLTFTIYKSIKQKRGYLAGIYIILGHATIELALMLALLAGASFFFQNIITLTVIGIIGGVLLLLYGILVMKDAIKSDINIDFEDTPNKGFRGNSYLGGIVVSLSNPYWEMWWAIIGLSLLISFDVSFTNPIGLVLFFLGHELGDAVWYLPVSTLAYFGGKSLNPKVFKYILIVCGVFMIVFGIYLAVNIVINPPKF